MTVHLVYPHGPTIAAPAAIGRKLAERLGRHYDVRLHDHHVHGVVRPAAGDVLIGHPHPDPLTVFRRSARQPGWSRVLTLCPYNEDARQVWYLDRVLPHCDLFLAITGPYWAERLPRTRYAHWQPKFVHLDLAIDRADFPVAKTAFNPAGSRRFVYVGRDISCKNVSYLEAIARAMPETRFAWIGGDRPGGPLQALGSLNFADAAARRRVAAHDFLITVGRADANPTTILEAMAWGLLPVCTPQSGYDGVPGIANVPLDDVPGAVRVLRRLQACDDAELRAVQQANWRELDRHYTWERFAGQVLDALRSGASPALARAPFGRRLRLRLAALHSPLLWPTAAGCLLRLAARARAGRRP